MLKKLLVLLTLMSMLLTMIVPCVNVSAAFSDGTNSFDAIDGGTIVMERSYTATQDGLVNFQLASHDETNSSTKKYNIIIKLGGMKVYSPGGTSEISKLALKEGETYLVTLVFRHYKDDTNGSTTSAKYYLYINGACVVNGGNDKSNGSNLIHDKIVEGNNNITTVFVSDNSDAVFDMNLYNATISSNDANIILDATEKRNDVAFGGFTAKILKAMTVSEFTQNITHATGATLSVKRGGIELADDAYIATGDVIEVKSQNSKVTNEYTVLDAPAVFQPAVSSTTYTVEESAIKDVYEYTPVDTFMSYLKKDEGWELTLKNGETEVTSGIVSEAMTLVATNGNTTQSYTIDIPDRVTKVSSANSGHSNLNKVVPTDDNFRGNFVVELDSTDLASGYYTGPGRGSSSGDPNSALRVSVDEGIVNLIINTYKNEDKYKIPTDFVPGDKVNFTIVARPGAGEEGNMIDYYINGDYVSTCSMNSILGDNWASWRFNKNTNGSAFMVEDLDAYMKAKNANKIKVDGEKVSTYFAGKSSDKLYLAVYSGNELESIQVANLSDFNFKADVLSVPASAEGKTVKVFLWSSDLTPIDFMKISEQTDILFDRDFES